MSSKYEYVCTFTSCDSKGELIDLSSVGSKNYTEEYAADRSFCVLDNFKITRDFVDSSEPGGCNKFSGKFLLATDPVTQRVVTKWSEKDWYILDVETEKYNLVDFPEPSDDDYKKIIQKKIDDNRSRLTLKFEKKLRDSRESLASEKADKYIEEWRKNNPDAGTMRVNLEWEKMKNSYLGLSYSEKQAELKKIEEEYIQEELNKYKDTSSDEHKTFIKDWKIEQAKIMEFQGLHPVETTIPTAWEEKIVGFGPGKKQAKAIHDAMNSYFSRNVFVNVYIVKKMSDRRLKDQEDFVYGREAFHYANAEKRLIFSGVVTKFIYESFLSSIDDKAHQNYDWFFRNDSREGLGDFYANFEASGLSYLEQRTKKSFKPDYVNMKNNFFNNYKFEYITNLGKLTQEKNSDEQKGDKFVYKDKFKMLNYDFKFKGLIEEAEFAYNNDDKKHIVWNRNTLINNSSIIDYYDSLAKLNGFFFYIDDVRRQFVFINYESLDKCPDNIPEIGGRKPLDSSLKVVDYCVDASSVFTGTVCSTELLYNASLTENAKAEGKYTDAGLKTFFEKTSMKDTVFVESKDELWPITKPILSQVYSPPEYSSNDSGYCGVDNIESAQKVALQTSYKNGCMFGSIKYVISDLQAAINTNKYDPYAEPDFNDEKMFNCCPVPGDLFKWTLKAGKVLKFMVYKSEHIFNRYTDIDKIEVYGMRTYSSSIDEPSK